MPTIERTKTTRKIKPAKVDRYGMTAENWERLDAKSEAEILAGCDKDPDARPLRANDPPRIGGRVAVSRRIRWKLRLSQAEFAKAYHIPIGTLRDWEQHRAEPDACARAYLAVIAAAPATVRKALAKAR